MSANMGKLFCLWQIFSRDGEMGIQKRHEEGIKEDRSEVRIEIAKHLKTSDWSNSEILIITGLLEVDFHQIG